jgi:hypothetical protein
MEAGMANDLNTAREQLATLYVECRECSNCGHIGINDDAAGMAACNTCDWNGPSPKEDHCPGCGRDGTMSGSCPECGYRTNLLAEAHLAAPGAAIAAREQELEAGGELGMVESHPNFVAGFKAGHAAGRKRASRDEAPPAPQQSTPQAETGEAYSYASKQATKCAGCGKHKHTPLRIDAMDGYVCLTCIDQKLGSLLGEFGYPDSARSLLSEIEDWLGELKQANLNGHVPQSVFSEASEFAERIEALTAAQPADGKGEKL